MPCTSVDLTALQVRAEGTAGNISVFTDKGLNAATVYYDWDNDPNPEDVNCPRIDGSLSIADHNHINFVVVPGEGYELNGNVKVRVGSPQGSDEDPDYADGVYSFDLDETEAYEIRIPLTGDGPSGGGDTNGVLTFRDLSSVIPDSDPEAKYSGTIYCLQYVKS